MSISAFKIANKLITGQAAIEQLAGELARLNINNPLIVTDAMLVKSGTVDLALANLGGRPYGIFDRSSQSRKLPSSRTAPGPTATAATMA